MEDSIRELREQITALRETRATHDEKISALSTRMNETSNDVKRILAYMEGAKGSWKTLVAIGGIATVVVEGIHQLVSFVHK